MSKDKKIIPINNESYSPIILRDELPWKSMKSVCVVYKLENGSKKSCYTCDNWGTFLEFLAILQYESMKLVNRLEEEDFE